MALQAVSCLTIGIILILIWREERRSRNSINRRYEFLSDLADLYGAPEACGDYIQSLSRPEDSRSLLEWSGVDKHSKIDEVRWAIFIDKCDHYGLVKYIDWSEDYSSILEEFEKLMKPLVGPMPQDQVESILAYLDSKQPIQRGSEMGWLFGPLAAYAADNGLKIVNINNNSDTFVFAILTNFLAKKWIGERLGYLINVEDPAWQFKSYLKKSPYEHILKR